VRIAYVITRADEVGGAHVHVRDMAAWMLNHGHEACVFVGASGPFTELLEAAAIPFRSLGFLRREIAIPRDWRAVAELSRNLAEYRPDLVSLHSAKAGLLGRLACRKASLPAVFTAHGWSFAEGVPQPTRSLYLMLERWAAPLTKKIITVCEADREYALSRRVGTAGQIVAVHNGMPEIAGHLLADPVHEPANVVMVARFEKQKDHATLIEALGELRNFDWHLQLVGGGPLIGDIRNLVDSHGLSERVSFLGRRDDVPEILAAADIFVLTSFWEGFPRSILEAMRASLPVVASRLAGVAEAIAEGHTGYLVDPGAAEQLRDRLLALIRDASLRKSLGQNGRARFEDRFTFADMAVKTLGVYQSVLSA